MGHHSVDEDVFDSAMNTPPLTAVKADYMHAGGGNGVFNPGGPGFPTQMNHGWSYSVDVIFATTQPPSHPAVTSVTPYAGSSSNPVGAAPTATFSEPVVSSTASFTLKDPNGTPAPGSTSFDSTGTVATCTPPNSLAPGPTYPAPITGA